MPHNAPEKDKQPDEWEVQAMLVDEDIQREHEGQRQTSQEPEYTQACRGQHVDGPNG